MAAPLSFPFYDFDKLIVYTATNPDDSQSIPMDEATHDHVSTNVDASEPNFYPTIHIAYMDGTISTFTYSSPCFTVADVINGWNFHGLSQRHTLTAASVEGTIVLTNLGVHGAHIFAGPYKYVGYWEAGASYAISTAFLCDDAVATTNTSTPILVTQEMPLFTISAYLYRKNKAVNMEQPFYTRTEVICAPLGYFNNLSEFIATLNTRISMRGERNGFVYHFTKSKTHGLAVASTHRQPEPSFVEIMPMMHNAFGADADEPLMMPLNTGKRLAISTRFPCIL